MNLKKSIVVSAVSLLAVASFIPALSASASKLNGNTYAAEATKSVVVTKAVKVYSVRTGKFEAQNKFTYLGKLKKGTHLLVSQYFMSTGGYIVKTKNNTSLHHDKNHFCLVSAEPTNHWYK